MMALESSHLVIMSSVGRGGKLALMKGGVRGDARILGEQLKKKKIQGSPGGPAV